MSHDGGKRRGDDRGSAILIYAQLVAEARALGAALLDHDGDDAGFRAALICGLARTRELSGVATLADDLGRRLAETRPGLLLGSERPTSA